jgi:hypothetical protein
VVDHTARQKVSAPRLVKITTVSFAVRTRLFLYTQTSLAGIVEGSAVQAAPKANCVSRRWNLARQSHLACGERRVDAIARLLMPGVETFATKRMFGEVFELHAGRTLP